jgi:hypothetical protein
MRHIYMQEAIFARHVLTTTAISRLNCLNFELLKRSLIEYFLHDDVVMIDCVVVWLLVFSTSHFFGGGSSPSTAYERCSTIAYDTIVSTEYKMSCFDGSS